MSKTPQTDAATIRIETPGFSGDIVFPGSAKHLETELNAANAQIAALREALKPIASYCPDEWLNPPFQDGYKKVNSLDLVKVRAAFSTPPPPVVPLEDVRPLREALETIENRFVDGEDTYEDWKFMGETAVTALATFTAKHPLP